VIGSSTASFVLLRISASLQRGAGLNQEAVSRDGGSGSGAEASSFKKIRKKNSVAGKAEEGVWGGVQTVPVSTARSVLMKLSA